MSKFKSEFDFSKVDMGILSNPAVEILHQDAIAFNEGLAESNLTLEEQVQFCSEAQIEFDQRWQYMDQPLRFSGSMSPITFLDETNVYFDHDAQKYVDNLSVVSQGFSTQCINGEMKIGHCFLYEEEPQRVIEGHRIINQVAGWARIEDILLSEDGLTNNQARENLEREAPEILNELDEILLNALSITDAIKRLCQFKLYKELSLQHRKPLDWSKFNTKMKIQYIECAFQELKETIEYYIASQLDMYEPVPYTVHHEGFQKIGDTIQYVKGHYEFYMLPEQIVFEPKGTYKGNAEARWDEDMYVPVMYGLAAFADPTHHSGYTQYVEAGFMMDEGFLIESNLHLETIQFTADDTLLQE